MGKLMVLLGLSLVMVLVVACGGDDTATPTTAPVSQAATTAAPLEESTTMAGEKREVHFFEVNALTGQSASPGTHAVHGIELAAKHVNDEGGFKDNCGNNYTVKLTVHDMANAREQAIAGLRKAADDPSVLVSLGSTPSTGFVPMVPVSGQVKLAIMGTGTAAPISEWNPYAFRVTVTTKAAVPQFMATMVERFDSFKKVALIYDITQDANRAEAELIRDLAGEIGYEIVAFEAFRGGDKDFRAQLTAIRGTDPGWVGIYGAAPEGTAIINQMSEMGFLGEVEFFTGFGSFNGANWWDLTDGKVKGGVNWAVGFDLGSEDSLMKKVVADYGTNFEEDIDIYSVYGYQAFQAAVDAVKRACTATDREAFRDALATTNIQALGGNVILDSPRDNPLGENRSGAIIVNRTTGREATEFEVIPLAGKESTTMAGEKREVHFFEVNALTGQSASPGTHAVHGIELAAKHVNDEGGFKDNCGNNYTVKLTVHDMANAREQAIAGLRKAADDPSVLVSLGSTPSTGFVPMVPVSGQVKLAIMGTGTAAPISEWNPYAFRVTVTTKAAVPQFMATMVERFDSFKKVALIYDITQDANRAEAELIRDLAGEIGYEIVAFEAFRGGDKDFRAQLTAIRGTDPGWVGIYGAAPEGTAIINQMSEMGFLGEVEFFTGFGSFNGANWWDLTDGKVKGGVNWAVGFDLGSEDSLMKKVVADYGTNFEEDIDIYSVYGYQAFQAAVDAVKRACTATDREAFRDALATTNIQALGGNVILDSPRDNPLGENRSGAIIVNRTTGREATEFEVIPLAK